MLSNESLGQMRICIWVRLDILAGLCAYKTDKCATGFAGVLANKGPFLNKYSIFSLDIRALGHMY